MRRHPTPKLWLTALVSAGVLLPGASAQTELPALRTSGDRPSLERPRSYDIPSTSRSSSRSSSSRIPDPGIFDGSQYPEEERPEQGMIAQFELPGMPQPSDQNVPGPGEQQGGGGQGPGGDSDMNSGGGPQVAMPGMNMPGIPGLNMPSQGQGGGGSMGIPGLPSMGGGGGGGEQPSTPQMPSIPGLESIAESDTGDAGKAGSGPQMDADATGPEGTPTQAGNGQAPEDAPQVADNQRGRALEKPSEMQIGDPNAALAEAGVPQADPNKATEAGKGEDRMAIKAASGNQSGGRGGGSERGVDIPSNL